MASADGICCTVRACISLCYYSTGTVDTILACTVLYQYQYLVQYCKSADNESRLRHVSLPLPEESGGISFLGYEYLCTVYSHGHCSCTVRSTCTLNCTYKYKYCNTFVLGVLVSFSSSQLTTNTNNNADCVLGRLRRLSLQNNRKCCKISALRPNVCLQHAFASDEALPWLSQLICVVAAVTPASRAAEYRRLVHKA